MASRSATAAKLGAANSSIDENMARIAHALDLQVGDPAPKAKDPTHRAAMQAERVSVFLSHVAEKVDPKGDALEAVAENLAVRNEVTPEPPPLSEMLQQQADEAQTIDEDDPDPKIGGHKLSFYEGKSDEQILRLKGVGEATLKQVREAQAARKG